MFDGFETREVEGGAGRIFLRLGGAGRPLLLLHGFPQTHLMWRDVAPRLAKAFTVICADLPGYGSSGCHASAPDHAPYTKRAMAERLAAAMVRLGFPRFAVAGHDRGGRVAYRLALDHPERVEAAAVLDVLPTGAVWARADDRFALAYWPWSLLAQPEPLPERILIDAPESIIEAALGGWGTPADVFPPEVRAAYLAALRDPEHAHAICEEYRAAASLDRAHDEADQASGRRIVRPLLALWSAPGPLGTWYEQEGGPIELWRSWADDVRGRGLDGGHFFPEELSAGTAEALEAFFAR